MAERIIYREKDELEFARYWQELLRIKKATYRYFLENLDTVLIVSKSKKILLQDKSFVYLVNNVPIAGVFLPIERIEGHDLASAVGSYIDAPLIADASFEKKIFFMIDDIAKDLNLAKIEFSVDPLIDSPSCNYLQKYDYLDSTILDYVIKLDSPDDLIKNVRKGHAGDIKKLSNDPQFQIFFTDHSSADQNIFNEYCRLHHKCAGKMTKAKETFDLQFKKIQGNKAVLFGLKFQGMPIAFSYFEYAFDKAVYFSGADDPDYDRLPLYHILLFSAMRYLKDIGIMFLDTGQPSSPSRQFDYYPDQKQLNIALFKRGFGGKFYSNFRGIKYFNREVFYEDLNIFRNNYIIN